MNLLPLSLIRVPRHEPFPHIPTNEDRIRAWQAARPVRLGNGLPWKWERPAKTTSPA